MDDLLLMSHLEFQPCATGFLITMNRLKDDQSSCLGLQRFDSCLTCVCKPTHRLQPTGAVVQANEVYLP